MRFFLLLLAVAGLLVALTVSRNGQARKDPSVQVDEGKKTAALARIEPAAFNVERLKEKADREKSGSAPAEYDASLRELERLEAEARIAGAQDYEISLRKYDASKKSQERLEAERAEEEETMSDIKARFDKDRAELEAKEAKGRDDSDRKLLELMNQPVEEAPVDPPH